MPRGSSQHSAKIKPLPDSRELNSYIAGRGDLTVIEFGFQLTKGCDKTGRETAFSREYL